MKGSSNSDRWRVCHPFCLFNFFFFFFWSLSKFRSQCSAIYIRSIHHLFGKFTDNHLIYNIICYLHALYYMPFSWSFEKLFVSSLGVRSTKFKLGYSYNSRRFFLFLWPLCIVVGRVSTFVEESFRI